VRERPDESMDVISVLAGFLPTHPPFLLTVAAKPLVERTIRRTDGKDPKRAADRYVLC
jgi:hypothetical protein